MSRPQGHRDELVGAVSRVLRVDDLCQEEVDEGLALAELSVGRNGRTKHRNRLRPEKNLVENMKQQIRYSEFH